LNGAGPAFQIKSHLRGGLAVSEPDMIVLPLHRPPYPTSVAYLLTAALFFAPSFSFAQQADPPQAAAPAQPAPPPTANKPGLIDALNKWFDKGAAELKDSFQKSGKAAKDATEALTKLPGARVVEGRELCAIAANGSPDCVAAAEAVCKGKGFASGKSLETQQTQKCPARVWLSGRLPADGECPVETFVIRSVCQ
jgi:hypothetical protein